MRIVGIIAAARCTDKREIHCRRRLLMTCQGSPCIALLDLDVEHRTIIQYHSGIVERILLAASDEFGFTELGAIVLVDAIY